MTACSFLVCPKIPKPRAAILRKPQPHKYVSPVCLHLSWSWFKSTTQMRTDMHRHKLSLCYCAICFLCANGSFRPAWRECKLCFPMSPCGSSRPLVFATVAATRKQAAVQATAANTMSVAAAAAAGGAPHSNSNSAPITSTSTAKSRSRRVLIPCLPWGRQVTTSCSTWTDRLLLSLTAACCLCCITTNHTRSRICCCERQTLFPLSTHSFSSLPRFVKE